MVNQRPKGARRSRKTPTSTTGPPPKRASTTAGCAAEATSDPDPARVIARINSANTPDFHFIENAFLGGEPSAAAHYRAATLREGKVPESRSQSICRMPFTIKPIGIRQDRPE